MRKILKLPSESWKKKFCIFILNSRSIYSNKIEKILLCEIEKFTVLFDLYGTHDKPLESFRVIKSQMFDWGIQNLFYFFVTYFISYKNPSIFLELSVLKNILFDARLSLTLINITGRVIGDQLWYIVVKGMQQKTTLLSSAGIGTIYKTLLLSCLKNMRSIKLISAAELINWTWGFSYCQKTRI